MRWMVVALTALAAGCAPGDGPEPRVISTTAASIEICGNGQRPADLATAHCAASGKDAAVLEREGHACFLGPLYKASYTRFLCVAR